MSAPLSLVDQVLDFYYALFDDVFTSRFTLEIPERIKRDQTGDRVKAAARAASESLIRYLQRRRVTDTIAGNILAGLHALIGKVSLEQTGNPNVAPERQAEELLALAPCPSAVERAGLAPDYRLALNGIARDLSRIGPVMVTWRKLGFPRRYEQLDRAIGEFEEITERMGAFGHSYDADADESFELDYRDYILQRFYQVEAGTVRMSTQTFIDLRRLFVMPDLAECAKPEKIKQLPDERQVEAMTLAAARELYARDPNQAQPGKTRERTLALKRIAEANRIVVIGPPGSGKSTFLEWLNLQLASAELEFPQGGLQAIPLLLRVRQLDPRKAPLGSGLIAAATEGRDRAERMPIGWIERQMSAGRVVFMLDGLDETDPDLRDRYLLPWLKRFCVQYPDCRFLVSSRPVGYPPRRLAKLGFSEAEVCDFTPEQTKEYATNWCTALRLARNEPERDARSEGEKEGQRIVDSFKTHAHITDLARNPLMLSAICLVNYFEGGHLPQDRALLYRLCVEGLLHHWDQRRGITSEFSLSDKLRVCREVAIAMQADNLAEMPEGLIRKLFGEMLCSASIGDRLLQHIRYRTGILIERRPKMFAFAHLTFQEYLAACAILEGNHLHIDATQAATQHADDRWYEVTALYCRIAPTPLARSMIETLLASGSTARLGQILVEAYFASANRLPSDASLRKRVIEHVSRCSARFPSLLERFEEREVSLVANRNLGRCFNKGISESFRWLQANLQSCNHREQLQKLSKQNDYDKNGLAEIIYVIHYAGKVPEFSYFMDNSHLYSMKGPQFVAPNEIEAIYETKPRLHSWVSLAEKRSMLS